MDSGKPEEGASARKTRSSLLIEHEADLALQCIRRFKAQHRHGPTRSAVARSIGVEIHRVEYLVTLLRARGFINWHRGDFTSVWIIADGEVAPQRQLGLARPPVDSQQRGSHPVDSQQPSNMNPLHNGWAGGKEAEVAMSSPEGPLNEPPSGVIPIEATTGAAPCVPPPPPAPTEGKTLVQVFAEERWREQLEAERRANDAIVRAVTKRALHDLPDFRSLPVADRIAQATEWIADVCVARIGVSRSAALHIAAELAAALEREAGR